jgi:SRSO17 transposase
MGDPEGVVIFAESGVPQKGHAAVGVARQYSGPLGKVDNCQVGVLAAYASRQGSAVVDQRLCLPEPWLTDADTRRRTQGQVPPGCGVQTTPQWAVALLRALRDEGVLPFKDVVADGLYGPSPALLEAVEDEGSPISFVSIPAETRCWVQGPVRQTKP